MDSASMEIVLDSDKQNAVYPFSRPYPFYVIIETGSTDSHSSESGDEKKADRDLEKLF